MIAREGPMQGTTSSFSVRVPIDCCLEGDGVCRSGGGVRGHMTVVSLAGEVRR